MLPTTPAVVLLILAAGGARAAAPEAPAYAAGVRAAGPLEDLRARAERERAAPDSRATALDPPAGMDAAAVRELAPADRTPATAAGMPLAEALAKIQGKGPPPALAPLDAAEAPDGEDLADALKLYAAARQQRADGRTADALASLEEAAKLDPRSPEVWQEIAECQAALGRRAASVSAMQQALRRGLSDPDALAAQGREALRSLRTEEALWLLIRASALTPPDSPPGVSVGLQLAEALDRSGYVSAASELFGRTLSSPVLGAGASRVSPELAETLRRRGELWQRAGDLSMRLGRVGDALTAYEQAAEEPTLDAGALAVRRVYAAVRLGRPAQAALAIVEKLGRPEATIEDRELALIRYLADRTDVGPLLSGSIGAVLSENATTPSAKSRVARAKAAALPLVARRAALVEHLAADPSDRRAAADLLAGFGPDQLAERTRALVSLVERRPAAADTCAALLLADGRGVRRSAEELGRATDPASRLLAAYLYTALGLGEKAVAGLDAKGLDEALRASVLAARADVAALVGDYAAAQAALADLDAMPPQRTALARVRALSALQRYTEALAAATPLVDSASADERLLASAVALQAGDVDLAERILVKLAEEDPQDERSADVLLRLYSRGARADQRRLAGVVQRLREKVSSSRVLRFASASELAQRGQWAAAEQSLVSLAEEDPTSVGLLDLLATVWIRGGVMSQERGEVWLRARLAAAPESVEAAAALAQVLAARGKGAEAVEMLDRLTQGAPMERLRRVREIITGESLGDAKGARELVVARLTPMPRTIEGTMTLAETLLGLERAEDAAPALRAGLPKGVPLTEDQRQRLSRLVAVMVQADGDRIVAGKTPVAGDAVTLLGELGIEAAPGVRESGVLLLALAEKPDLPRIAAEFGKLGTEGTQELVVLSRIIQKILATKKPAAILPLTEAVCTLRPEPLPESLRLLSLSIGQFGEASDLRRLLPTLTKGNRAEQILDRMAGNGEAAPAPGKRAGMLAYRIAGVASNQERYAQAAGLYEVSLELDGEHAIALNDYGYMLLEHDPSDRAKVQKLLERAYELDATSYNIADSLGWLRYKQGRFADDPALGAVGGAGALSLLKRAIELQERDEDGFADPFIIDHYGDALWVAGKKDAALAQWQLAESKGQTNLRMRADNLADDAYSKLLRKTIESAVAKKQAAREGREPALEARWTDEPKKP